MDNDLIERYNLTEKQYWKLCGIYRVRQRYPKVFTIFWQELLVVKDDLQHRNNADAQELWNIWNH